MTIYMPETEWKNGGATLAVGPITRRRLIRKAFSVSAAQAFSQCPARWVASQLVPRQQHPLDAAPLGVHAHAILEAFYRDTPASERTRDELEARTATYLDTFETESKALASLTEDLARDALFAWPFGTHSDPVKIACQALEQDHPDWSENEWLAVTTLLNRFAATEPKGNKTGDYYLQRIVPGLIDEARDIAALANEDLARWRAEITRMTLGDLTLEDPTEVDVVAVEHRFQAQRLPNGAFLNGFIDRVDRLPDLTIQINDYKTGAFREPFRGQRDEKADQIRIYAAAYMAATGETVTEGRLLYTGNLPEPGTEATEGCGLPKTVDMSPAAIDDSINWLKNTHDAQREAVKVGEFTTNPSPLCAWCPLAKACPVAQIGSASQHKTLETGTPGTVRYETARAKLAKAEAARDTQPDPDTLGIRCETDTPQRISEAHDTTTTQGVTPMPAPQHPAPLWTRPTPRPEARPYEELVAIGPGEQILNLGSYAAMRSYGIASLALEIANKGTARVTKTQINAIAELLTSLVRDVEIAITGRSSMNSGASTRVMGLVRTLIDQYEVPDVNDHPSEWHAWYVKSEHRAVMLAEVAEHVHDTAAVVNPTSAIEQLTAHQLRAAA